MNQDIVVVDTSVIIKWLNQDNEDYIEQADKVLKDAELNKIIIIAPELAKYEVGNVLLMGKHLSVDQATSVLSQFYKLPISFIEDNPVVAEQTVSLAIGENVTYYDASFMSLASQYEAVLITDNIKDQAKPDKIKVIPLKDY
jgi:predicted nucleic acid-binding protein